MVKLRLSRTGTGMLMLGTLVLGGLACSGVPAETDEEERTTSELTGTAYAIRSHSNGLCFDSATTGGILALRDCKFSNNASQKWGFPLKAGFAGFFVQSFFANTCVSVFAQSSSGFAVKIETVGSSATWNQELWHIPGRAGVPDFSLFKLQNESDGRCMTSRQIGSAWQINEETCVSSGSTNDAQTFMLDTF
jgi:hypothetical protein